MKTRLPFIRPRTQISRPAQGLADLLPELGDAARDLGLGEQDVDLVPHGSSRDDTAFAAAGTLFEAHVVRA